MIDITLKNVQVNEALSRETFNFSAVLVADGVEVATVGNDGHGGADRVIAYMPGQSEETFKALNERVRAEYPQMDMSAYGMEPADTDLEGVCHQLVEAFLVDRDLDKLLKNKLVFFPDGLPAEGTTMPLMTMAMQRAVGRRPADTVESLTAYVRKEAPNAYVLNDRPREEQRAAYLMATAG